MNDKSAMIKRVKAQHLNKNDEPKVWDISGSCDLFAAVRQWERASGMTAKTFGFTGVEGEIFIKWIWPTERSAYGHAAQASQ